MLPIIQSLSIPAFAVPGPMELVIILVIVLVVFGPKKLPEIGKAIGQGVKELKKATEAKEEPAEEKEKKE